MSLAPVLARPARSSQRLLCLLRKPERRMCLQARLLRNKVVPPSRRNISARHLSARSNYLASISQRWPFNGPALMSCLCAAGAMRSLFRAANLEQNRKSSSSRGVKQSERAARGLSWTVGLLCGRLLAHSVTTFTSWPANGPCCRHNRRNKRLAFSFAIACQRARLCLALAGQAAGKPAHIRHRPPASQPAESLSMARDRPNWPARPRELESGPGGTNKRRPAESTTDWQSSGAASPSPCDEPISP